MEEKRSEVFIARQPIFNERKQVEAYELLFRSGLNNAFDPTIDQDYASRKMMSDAIHLWGMDALIGGHRAFVNLTENVFLSDFPFVFDKDRVVLEILETVRPTPEVLDQCRELKKRGFVLALDDYEGQKEYEPFFEYIDILKVDFLQTNPEERSRIVDLCKRDSLSLLAEKVEGLEDYRKGLTMGYTLFQGYFFSKPEIMSGRDIPSQKLGMLQLMQKIYQPDLDFGEVERLVSQDVALSYKLMRFINSVSFGLKKEIKSIRHALVLLGESEIRKWVSLMALSQMGDDKPHELVVLSLCRAVFLKELAGETKFRRSEEDLFLAGLFSSIDGFLDQPMDQLVAKLPLAEPVKDLLCEKPSPYSDLFHLMLAYERGDWNEISLRAQRSQIDELAIPTKYQFALKEASKLEGLK